MLPVPRSPTCCSNSILAWREHAFCMLGSIVVSVASVTDGTGGPRMSGNRGGAAAAGGGARRRQADTDLAEAREGRGVPCREQGVGQGAKRHAVVEQARASANHRP